MQPSPLPFESINNTLQRNAGRTFSFAFAAGSTFAITFATAYNAAFPSTRVAMALIGLLGLQSAVARRLYLPRECVLYALFVVYMLIQLFWTDNTVLALNTLFPSVNFALIIVLFVSLMMSFHRRSVLLGIWSGTICAAMFYTLREGFPFVWPSGFSYNAMAVLYIFLLILSVVLATTQRYRSLFLLVAAGSATLVLATTSIKANLGILLGVTGAAIVYRQFFGRLFVRNLLLIFFLVSALVIAVTQNEALTSGLDRGINRIGLGLEILQAREDISGYSGYGKRSDWAAIGIKGWAENPLFGYGVEAFRNDYGMTSHTTPIELLYNSGLIGLILFYSVFVALLLRLYQSRNRVPVALRAIILAGIFCFGFITLSGTMHYNKLLAAFIGISVGLLRQPASQNVQGNI